jgi:hypothetical protein
VRAGHRLRLDQHWAWAATLAAALSTLSGHNPNPAAEHDIRPDERSGRTRQPRRATNAIGAVLLAND